MNDFIGGSWIDTEQEKLERHHLLAWDTLKWLTPMSKDESPVIQMEKDDHIKTLSYGGRFFSEKGYYREWQSEELIRGNFWTAWEVDKRHICSLFGDKYDKAFEQAEAQARKLEAEGKLKVDAEKLQLYRERQELEKQEKLADEKLKEANAKKYQSEADKQREVEKAKAEQDRIEAQKELNKSKLEERHCQLQKEIAEKQLAEAKEKSQTEEVKRLEQAVQKETANLKEAEATRKEAEARMQGRVEEYAKQKEAEQQQQIRELQDRVKQLEAEVQQKEAQFARSQSELLDRTTQLEQRDRALVEAVQAKEQLFQAQQSSPTSQSVHPVGGESVDPERQKEASQEPPKDWAGLHTHPHLVRHEMQGGDFHTSGIPATREEAQFDPIKRVVTGVERALQEYYQQKSQDRMQELQRSTAEFQQLQQRSSHELDVHNSVPPQQKRFDFEIGR